MTNMCTIALIDETIQESAMDIDDEVCVIIKTDDLFRTRSQSRSNSYSSIPLHVQPPNKYIRRSNSYGIIPQYLQPMNKKHETSNLITSVKRDKDVIENFFPIFNSSELDDAIMTYDWKNLLNTDFSEEKPTISKSNNSLNENNDWNVIFHKLMEPDVTPSCQATKVDEIISDYTNTAHESEKKKRKRNRKKPNYEPDSKIYVIPNDKDVLLGRGGRTNHHPGNKRYLQKKETIQPRYLVASKEAKTDISQELVDTVKQWGGRFLKQDVTGKWYKVLNIVARKKASQTLREKTTADDRKAKRQKYGYLSTREQNQTNNI